MKYAFIQNNTIIEIVQTDPFILFVPHYAEQFIEVPDNCQTGDVFDNGEWVTPATVSIIPQEITMRQARLVLLANGLLANVQAAINSLPEPDKTKAQIEWDYSNALQRDNSFVAVLGAALGLTSEGVDSLFIEGATM